MRTPQQCHIHVAMGVKTSARVRSVGMPIVHHGSTKAGPDEGLYDTRVGAAGYSPIVASFGALAVTAIVVVFTQTTSQNQS